MSYSRSYASSSSTVKVSGQPTLHESHAEYADSTGEAHARHVRAVGDKKETQEWHKPAGKPLEQKRTLENASEEDFEKDWSTYVKSDQPDASALEDKK